MIETRVITTELVDDLGSLFCSNKYTEKCWCMWHIIAVKVFHAGGAGGNRAQFRELISSADTPMGILAYRDDLPVGWCAVGPRGRYARAIKTPTYRTKSADKFTNVWLVPCFFIHADVRGMGLSKHLLTEAVGLAQEHNAEAVDGFPFTSDKRRSSSQIHVGFESTFLACEFEPIRRPSDSRIVMRRILA